MVVERWVVPVMALVAAGWCVWDLRHMAGHGSGGDEQVSMQHKRALKTTIIATAGAMGMDAIIRFIAPIFGRGGSLAGAPTPVAGISTVLQDMTTWLLAIVPLGGGMVGAYHWFMSGPGDGGE